MRDKSKLGIEIKRSLRVYETEIQDLGQIKKELNEYSGVYYYYLFYYYYYYYCYWNGK